jgi:tubulin--tyrosine ligase
VFGVDLLLNFPKPTDTSPQTSLPVPRVTILEYNASPDLHQSGERLRSNLAEMFQGVVRISIAPFFGLEIEEEEESDQKDWDIGTEKWGWTLVGKGEVRGPGA